MNIPIVVSAFNRKACLERLLKSLNQSFYSKNVKLIISIDGGGTKDVSELAESFDWNHGEKEIISHTKNLGLRRHILSCGRLSKKYDGIILLEDDLFVAPHFYDYVIKTQSFYRNDQNISGVALYSHKYNETACLPFIPIEDGNDVYFMQLGCSWGQCWLTHQWERFDKWYEDNSGLDLSNDICLPPDVMIWPNTSWKKYFIKYMIEKNKYFVYPRISHVTNFGDAGQHHRGTKVFQVPLQYSQRDLILPEFSQSGARYDSYCEILPECLKQFAPELMEYDLEVDLYGLKEKNTIRSDYVLTKQHCSHYVHSYGCELKPHETNIIEKIKGDCFFITHKDNLSEYGNFLSYRERIISDYEKTHSYFYAITNSHYNRIDKQIKKYISDKIDFGKTPVNKAEQIQLLSNYINIKEQRIKDLETSYSYKLGYSIINPLRKARMFIKQMTKR